VEDHDPRLPGLNPDLPLVTFCFLIMRMMGMSPQILVMLSGMIIFMTMASHATSLDPNPLFLVDPNIIRIGPKLGKRNIIATTRRNNVVTTSTNLLMTVVGALVVLLLLHLHLPPHLTLSLKRLSLVLPDLLLQLYLRTLVLTLADLSIVVMVMEMVVVVVEVVILLTRRMILEVMIMMSLILKSVIILAGLSIWTW
jgi:hypothetical protein